MNYNYIKYRAICQAIEIKEIPFAKAPNHQLAVFPTICWLCTDFLTRPSAYLPAYLPACLSVCLSVCLSICLSVYLSVPTCLYLPTCAYLSMPTVCAYRLYYLSMPTVCTYLSMLPVYTYHLYLPSVPPVHATVYTYLSVIWGRGQPDQRLCLIQLID